MYLSQLMLNPHWRKVRNDLADRYELHRTILNAFPETLPDHERVLYRVEESKIDLLVRILVQSQTPPDWASAPRLEQYYLLEEPRIREVFAKLQNGSQLQFRLQANPTVKRDGKRHAIYADDALLTWLRRKGEQHGFILRDVDVRFAKLGKKYGKKRQQIWHAVQYDGLLTLSNSELFEQALMLGIGSAKVFGFGLLSIPYPTY